MSYWLYRLDEGGRSSVYEVDPDPIPTPGQKQTRTVLTPRAWRFVPRLGDAGYRGPSKLCQAGYAAIDTAPGLAMAAVHRLIDDEIERENS